MHRHLKAGKRKELNMYIFILPGIVGFIFFWAIPIIYAFVLSLNNSDGLTSQFIGLQNYITMFKSHLYWTSIYNTLYMVVLGVPFNLSVAFVLAMILHKVRKGAGIFRTIFYIPTILPGVATSILLMNLFQTKNGLLNRLLGYIGIPQIDWLGNPALTKLTFIFMGGWTVGALMIMFLVGLESIPTTYYEAARIDGANAFQQFLNVTLPQLTPAILYNLIIQLVLQLQIFTPAFIMTQGGPENSTYFYVYKIWKDAFQNMKIGYASAEGIILYIFSLALTIVILKSSNSWVHYGGGNNG